MSVSTTTTDCLTQTENLSPGEFAKFLPRNLSNISDWKVARMTEETLVNGNLELDPYGLLKHAIAEGDDEDDLDDGYVEEIDENGTRVRRRRSSIRERGRSPPITPTRKKSVRFADALGLDLETVRHVLYGDEDPLSDDSGLSEYYSAEKLSIAKYLEPLFAQPSGEGDFMVRIQRSKVCLENTVISDLTIMGTIKVLNISYDKFVTVRYTVDFWKTWKDLKASYVHGSCDGPTDRFSFALSLSGSRELQPQSQLELCVRYDAGGEQFWDNNKGKNYCFECYAAAANKPIDKFMNHFL